MSLLTLLSNLMLIFVLMISGVILLFIKTIPHPCNKSYRIAKRYVAYMWLLSSISVIISLTAGKFNDDRIEILSICSITSFSIGSFLGIYSLLYLYNTKQAYNIRKNIFNGYMWGFSLPLFLVLLHYIMTILQGSQQVYSIEEYINSIAASPILITRTAILGTTITSILISVIQYFKTRREHEAIEDLSEDNAIKHAQWMDKKFYLITPIATFITFSNFVNSVYYHALYDLMLISIVIFYTIKIINYQYLFHTVRSILKIIENKGEEIIEKKTILIEKNEQIELAVPSSPIIKGQCDPKLARIENKRRMIHESIERWTNDEEKAYLRNGLTIQDVSLMTGIPKRRLADFIHQNYNLSFNSWINTLRVREVEQLLTNKENYMMTLSEISYKTGFSDLSNMSSTFKKIKGINPSEYRALINQ